MAQVIRGGAALLVALVPWRHLLGPTPAMGARPKPHARHDRRSFLRWAVLGGLAVALGQLAVAVTRLGWPNGVLERQLIAIPEEQAPAINATPFRVDRGKFYLVRTEAGLLALAWNCTPLGCTLPWLEHMGLFMCPCHPAQFDRVGAVVDGVAPRPLDLYAVTVEGDTIYVNTASRRRRGYSHPSQATPF